jgi:hypothetical protein
MKNLLFYFLAPYLFATITIFGITTEASGEEAIKVTTSYSESMVGDHFVLKANINGFQEPGSADSKCAPLGAEFAVHNFDPSTKKLDLTFPVIKVKPAPFSAMLGLRDDEAVEEALKICHGTASVNGYTNYQLDAGKLDHSAFKRKGIAFGGLIVPFKFRLGNAKELVSSSTIAPYVGVRTSVFQGWGLTLTPLVSAGLGVVPVADASGKGTNTKAALSTAAGLLLTSNKSEQFSVGALVGRDFLGRTDREADSAVNKLWISLYIGMGF